MNACTATLVRRRPLVTLPGVYTPQDDTRLLLHALYREGVGPGTELLDLGTGSGALALGAARCGAHVTAVDIAWRAVFTTWINARLARLPLTVRRSDLATAVRGRTFDLFVSNPPYVPAPGVSLPRGAARAWDAGCDGRLLIDRICDLAPAALRPGGVLLMVHSGLCGASDTLSRLGRAGLRAEISDRTRIPFGPVLRSRLSWLRSTGLPHGAGGGAGQLVELTEELVIIRAERPRASAPY
ncbi:HemK2/MTQ2 family protein methyltransferase [Streptomyces halobius]|uniref:Methyltransferase n=1 Tax=Streptomyces halobius TaxID=2879846 RepID=A0ABY4M0A8_9ACTN|nr:HemK2/MTQ2 family protein methyltransferase [Streptomyces halobius]UQA91179.1 methyltransferase [Streptomyces halobius]